MIFRIAHISDLHIPPLPRMALKQLAGKRLLALFSWHHKWKSEHRQLILDALQKQLLEIGPDHICVTGDITYTALPAEIDQAADWFAGLGEPQQISLIPGNHDAYVPGAQNYALRRWAPWMQDDEGNNGFPYLHRRGPVNIIGVSSAVPTPPAVSLGRIGRDQLEKVRGLLARIREERRPVLLLVHHAPQDGAASRLRALADRKDLQKLLACSPVDLILHGHLHHPVRSSLPGPSGPIPVLGAASGSAVGDRKSSAHFHLIDIETNGQDPQITVHHYHYDHPQRVFSAGESFSL